MTERVTCECCEDNNAALAHIGPGPWTGEPNRIEFRHAGLPCILHRGGMGAWCGYVGLSPNHPLHGVGYSEAGEKVGAHGGLTYAKPCAGCVCHVPKPGEAENLWWLGFDCGHAGDMTPRQTLYSVFHQTDHYWTAAECRVETERLAEQLAVIVKEVGP
jgi:hypothetical protein